MNYSEILVCKKDIVSINREADEAIYNLLKIYPKILSTGECGHFIR